MLFGTIRAFGRRNKSPGALGSCSSFSNRAFSMATTIGEILYQRNLLVRERL
jgi:hypothetical protein